MINSVCDDAAVDSENEWLLDSGASRHIASKRHFFSEFTQLSTRDYVLLGDDRRCSIEGVGTVKIWREIDNKWLPGVLENVLYVPDLKKNLVSVGVLDKDYEKEIRFRRGKVYINKNKKLILTGEKLSNDIYLLNLKVQTEEKNFEVNATAVSEAKLWHEGLDI